MGGIVNRVAVAVLLLALLGVAACARPARKACCARRSVPTASDATPPAPPGSAKDAPGVRAEDDPPAPKPKAPVPGTTQPVAPPEPPGKTARSVPEPPFAWLAPYAEKPTTPAMFTTLREKLFRTEKDADLIRGASWLVHAKSPVVRTAVGRILADAYLLGDHLGADPVPALRILARDPDQDVRWYMLSALAMHNSPLARELYFKHWTGEIRTPAGEAGVKIRREIEANLRKYASEEKLEKLRAADEVAQQAWFNIADDRPAGEKTDRFETGEITVGRENGVELETLPGTRLWVDPVTTAHGAKGHVGSGDMIMLWMATKGGGKMGSGGAQPYTGGVAYTGDVSIIDHARYLGKDRVRYWVRVDPDGLAYKHHRRKR